MERLLESAKQMRASEKDVPLTCGAGVGITGASAARSAKACVAEG